MREDLTVREVVRLYLADKEILINTGRYKRSSLDMAKLELDRLCGHFGDRKIVECSQRDLTVWLTMNPAWRSCWTQKRVTNVIVACFRWAEEEELISRAPYRRPRALKRVPLRIRRPIEPFEYVALMRRSNRVLRRALLFMRRVGCRTCEMRQLVWSNVVLETINRVPPHIKLVNHKTSHVTGQPRIIGLDRGTVGFLRSMKRKAIAAAIDGASPELTLKEVEHLLAMVHVFLNRDGNPWKQRTFCKHLREAAERIGLDAGVTERLTAYGLRHLYAVTAIEAGVTSRRIADQMGHQSTSTLDKHYASHSRFKARHVSDVANEIADKRRRQEPLPKAPSESSDVARPIADGPHSDGAFVLAGKARKFAAAQGRLLTALWGASAVPIRKIAESVHPGETDFRANLRKLVMDTNATLSRHHLPFKIISPKARHYVLKKITASTMTKEKNP